MFQDLIDPESGDVIGYYDTDEQLAIPLASIDQDAADRAAAIMLADTGVTPGFGFDRPQGVIDYAGLLPPPDPIAAGLNPANIVKTAAGALWQYKPTRSPTGVVGYTAVPYTGAAPGKVSPVMWAAIAGLAILALT
jgi:hypothetical protein